MELRLNNRWAGILVLLEILENYSKGWQNYSDKVMFDNKAFCVFPYGVKEAQFIFSQLFKLKVVDLIWI